MKLSGQWAVGSGESRRWRDIRFAQIGSGGEVFGFAVELIHLPDKPAGVWAWERPGLADELIHLPGKPAGVYAPGGFIPPERKFRS